MAKRQCGDCTLCCTVLRVPEFSKPEMQPCKHCAVGCTIYVDRPRSCRDFNCAWLMGDMDDDMRPDKSHVLIERLPDDTVVLAMVEPGYEHVLAGLNDYLSEYIENGVSVVANNGLGLLSEGTNPVDVRNAVVDSARLLGVI